MRNYKLNAFVYMCVFRHVDVSGLMMMTFFTCFHPTLKFGSAEFNTRDYKVCLLSWTQTVIAAAVPKCKSRTDCGSSLILSHTTEVMFMLATLWKAAKTSGTTPATSTMHREDETIHNAGTRATLKRRGTTLLIDQRVNLLISSYQTAHMPP